MFAAFIVPFLGSLAGKLALKLLGSVMNSSGEKPAGDASSAGGFKDNFLSLLKAQPASQTQPAAATPGALAATDQANALALGRPSGRVRCRKASEGRSSRFTLSIRRPDRQPGRSGFRIDSPVKRLKSRSAVQSSRMPWSRQRAATRASWT